MTEWITLPVERLPHAPAELPEYKTEGSVGMDLQAAIEEPITLKPLERAMIPTGLVIALPEGFEAQIRSRSGLAIKHGVAVINGVGTIDWDYRHEVKVGLVNLSNDSYTIEPGDRVAQMVVAPVTKALWQPVPSVELAEASGRSGGFGSTGR
jgi:dUTP pyrophosphatase